MKSTKTILPLMHMIVDALCICCLCMLSERYGGSGNILGLYFAYNVMAFLTQPLTGWLADNCRAEKFALLHCVLLTAVVIILAWSGFCSPPMDSQGTMMYAVIALLGLGNSTFHVWAGRLTSLLTCNDIRWLGVFVSTGAVGLSLGSVLASWVLAWILTISICWLTLIYLRSEDMNKPLFATGEPLHHAMRRTLSGNTYTRVDISVAFSCIMVMALMAIVMVRSHAGSTLNGQLPHSSMMILAAGMVTMAGKIAGGWIAQRIGLATTFLTAAIVTALCAALASEGAFVILLGLFAVNSTMPLTLYMINVVMRGREGLAFGLLAASLMPTYIAMMISQTVFK